MSKIFAVEPSALIQKLAGELKSHKEIIPPEWSRFCKTGAHKERPPVNDDWWYVRAASVMRSILKLGPVGTQKLRVKYGGRKNCGYKPEHHYSGSGSIIRKILQQLESAGLLKKVDKGKHKGRIISEEGKKLLNKAAGQE
jgi:small subunit ribosomal protein S19e